MLKLSTSITLRASHSTKRLACFFFAVAAPEAASTWCSTRPHVSSHLHLSSILFSKSAPQPHALVANGVASAHDATTIALSRDALQVQHVDREVCLARQHYSVRDDIGKARVRRSPQAGTVPLCATSLMRTVAGRHCQVSPLTAELPYMTLVRRGSSSSAGR